jgi:polysaccharide biosynthesis protein PslH
MRDALLLCPEAPYPVAGGGALRTACMLEYLARHYALDVIVFREPGAPDPAATIPSTLVRSVQVIDLPFHSKSMPARLSRNLDRFRRSIPPLMDRFGGFPLNIARRYDLAVIEHFWCAPYMKALRAHCARIALNLHNIESVLLQRSAGAQSLIGRRLLNEFAAASRRLESELLPQFDTLLVTSEADRAFIDSGIVWPNTIPEVPIFRVDKRDEIVFSGNMAYQPNIDAVRFFASRIWPQVSKTNPILEWRLAGKNPDAVHLPKHPRVRITGPMDDAIAEIAAARVAVVPLLSGSGTRFKIIEAWAAGTPVISTTIGAEGLDATDGEHLLIADTPGDFCDAITTVLIDKSLARRLAAAGRALYEEKFTWPSAWKILEAAGL